MTDIVDKDGNLVGTSDDPGLDPDRLAEKIRKDRRQLKNIDQTDTAATLAELVQSVRRVQRALIEMLGEGDED